MTPPISNPTPAVFRLALTLSLMVVACAAVESADSPPNATRSGSEESIDFNRDIRPLLSENCAFCHGPDEETRQAGLRLDTQEGASFVVEPHSRGDSELFQRIVSDDPDLLMPPPDSNRELTAEEIERIGRWIDQGANWQSHWSFRPIQSPPVPDVAERSPAIPAQNPIDAFIQRRLHQEGLQPSPEASRRTLIRRLSLDLTGLPPSPLQVQQFLADERPDAYERLVDRLLQSPAYGQRMAWPWLDAARYADTNGYQGDRERTMWPWRDWVVQAFNENLPFDQFTLWQIAGDLLPEPSEDQILATGFNRNHMINGEGGRIAEENRVEYVMDMTETMGTVWLGLTLNCCRCHDHKFDPISNEEYYKLFAFFNQTPVDGGGGDPQTPPNLALPDPSQQSKLQRLNRQIASLDRKIRERKEVMKESEAEKTKAEETEEAETDDAELKALQQQRKQRVDQRNKLQQAIPKVMVMADKPEPRKTFVLSRGLYNQPQGEVEPGLPEFLPAGEIDEATNRLDLARWLVDPENPLTARVTVNRFWQQFFGTGLVKTTEDFGAQGETPPHMALLNWMSAYFVDHGWDVKDLVRLIVTSHTYRQSSRIANRQAYEADPENRFLSRGVRYRLPSWMLRDQALAAAGLLSPRTGGPSINTYQPKGIWEEASFGKKQYQRGEGEKLYRRSLYVFWRRIVAPTMFFDSASRQSCTVKVSRTNTPLHALQTLNNVAYVESARHLARRALRSDRGSDADRVDQIFLHTLARPASEAERRILLAGLQRSRAEFSAQPEAAIELLSQGESPRDASLDVVEHAAWTSLALAVLNLDETLNRE